MTKENKLVLIQDNLLKLKKVAIGKIFNQTNQKTKLNLEVDNLNEKKNIFIKNSSNFIEDVNSLHLQIKKAKLNKKYSPLPPFATAPHALNHPAQHYLKEHSGRVGVIWGPLHPTNQPAFHYVKNSTPLPWAWRTAAGLGGAGLLGGHVGSAAEQVHKPESASAGVAALSTGGEISLLRSIKNLSSVKAQRVRKFNLYEYIKSIYSINTELSRYQIMDYNFNKNNNMDKLINEIIKILENYFHSISTLISKPIFKITPEKVVIQLFYYVLKNRINKKLLRKRSRSRSKLIAKNYQGISIFNSKIPSPLPHHLLHSTPSPLTPSQTLNGRAEKKGGGTVGVGVVMQRGGLLLKRASFLFNQWSKKGALNLNQNQQWGAHFHPTKEQQPMPAVAKPAHTLVTPPPILIGYGKGAGCGSEEGWVNKKRFFTGYYKTHKLSIRIITSILSKIFNRPVEFHLIRLYKPYLDSNILAYIIGLMGNKLKLRKILNRLFRRAKIKSSKQNKNKNTSTLPNKYNKYNKIGGRNRKMISLSLKNIIPSILTGIKIRVAGRLLTQRITPRKTVKNYQKGRLARSKAILVNTSRFTRKNKRGIFSITVSTGHWIN